MRCGDCEHYIFFAGPYGRCAKASGFKKIMIDADASKCTMFSQLQHVETDTRQSTAGAHFRPSEYGYQERKSDTKVDPNKTKDSKQWG